MGVFCACAQTQTNGNTGTSNAALQLKRASSYILVPTYADDGTKNVILSTDFVNGKLPAAFIEEKINHTDPSKRWYPVNDIRSPSNERADPEQQSFDGGQNNQITSEGLRPVAVTVIDRNAKYKKNLGLLSCKYKLSFFEIDECGALGGEEAFNNPTILEPHPIASKTFYVKLVKANATDAQTLMLMFEYDQRKSKDENECIIPAFAIDADLCDQNGLLNLLVDYSGIANAAFTATLKLEYGGFGGNIAQTGLVAADFVLKDLTAGADIAITSVTESPGGTYAFVTAAMTAGNTMQLQIADDGTKYEKPFEIQSKTFVAVA